MRINLDLLKNLRGKLNKADFNWVLIELRNVHLNAYDIGWKDGYAYRIKEVDHKQANEEK